MLIVNVSDSKICKTCNGMKLILKSKKLQRLKGLKVYHVGSKLTNSLECRSVVPSGEIKANVNLLV